MKKILLMFVLFMSTLLLVACTDAYDLDSFGESDIVEMSAEEVSTMLEAVDWEQVGEAMSIAIEADVNVTLDSSISFGDAYSVSSQTELALILDSTSYVLDSETVTDVALHSETDVELSFDKVLTANDVESSTSFEGNGSINAYLSNGFVYLNPEVSITEGGTETTISGKEKLDDELTQEMWDEYRSNEYGIDITGNVGYSSDIPENILELMSWQNLSEFMESFPAMTIYQKGTVTNVHIEIDKQLILDNLEDLLIAVVDMAEEAGEDVGIPEEIEDNIEEAVTEVEDMLDYFSALMMTVDIVIDNGNLVKYAVAAEVVTTDAFLEEMDMSIDATFSMEMNVGVEIPDFPNDLGDYEAVSQFGNNYDLGDFYF